MLQLGLLYSPLGLDATLDKLYCISIDTIKCCNKIDYKEEGANFSVLESIIMLLDFVSYNLSILILFD